LDRRAWFIDFAKIAGRKNLHKYFISVIKSILSSHYDEAREEEEIRNALDSLNLALNDESLPWDVMDVKKTPTAMEVPKKISQHDYIEISEVAQ